MLFRSADAAGFQGIDVEQAAADGDGHDGIAAVAENLPAQAEARVFDADAGIFIVKQIGQDAKKRNRPGTDDDLRWLCKILAFEEDSRYLMCRAT